MTNFTEVLSFSILVLGSFLLGFLICYLILRANFRYHKDLLNHQNTVIANLQGIRVEKEVKYREPVLGLVADDGESALRRRDDETEAEIENEKLT